MDNERALIDRGIRLTPQRLAIVGFLAKSHDHPTAEQIYSALKSVHPSLSKATVYKTLDLLKAHGIVDELTISKPETRYDYHRPPHHHFLCRICGQIYDIEISCPLLDTVQLNDHRIEEVHGYFKGVCKMCLDQEQ